MVYGRGHGGRQLTLLHSGKLWHDALVLLDEETGSLWSQASGEAILGPLAGARLDRIPSERTTWEAWLARHPDTSVLPSEHRRRRLKLKLYPYADMMLGMLGTRNPDKRLEGKVLVAGFAAEGAEPLAVVLKRKDRPQEARVSFDGRAILVRHEGGLGPTRAWLSDGPPDWEPREQVPVQTMYWFVWAALHPGSRLVQAEPVGDRS